MKRPGFNPQEHFDYIINVGGNDYTLLQILKMSEKMGNEIFDAFSLQEDKVKTLLGEDYKSFEYFSDKGVSLRKFIYMRNLEHQMPMTQAQWEHDMSVRNGGIAEEDKGIDIDAKILGKAKRMLEGNSQNNGTKNDEK